MIRNIVGRFLTCRTVLNQNQQFSKRCLSLHQSGSTPAINRILPSVSLLIPTPPRTLPSINEALKDPSINIWRLPQHLPLPAIPSLINEIPISRENPDLPKIEKQAARMIVIRRRKMKKHQLRKLRKRRKFEYRRIALKRKTLKEKNFQMELSSQILAAKSFDARTYVQDMIRKAKEDVVYIRPPKNPAKLKNPALVDEKGERIRLNLNLYGGKK